MSEKTGIVPTTTLAYLAGMIDGDGFITITRAERKGVEYFAASVGIAGTRREPHDMAASIWGGKVYCYMPKNETHRPQFQWSRQGAVAAKVIEAIQPYLLVKSEHAALALELHEHVLSASSDDPFPWFSPNYDPLPAMRRMREEMVGINQSRNRLRKKPAPKRI